MAYLSPEASDAFKLPLFEISILQNMVALEAFVTFYPSQKTAR
jgi:hypothetical protein